jgi:hypothetical protein
MRRGLGADSEEKREPVSDIDNVVVVDGLKALDPKRPMREATDLRWPHDLSRLHLLRFG